MVKFLYFHVEGSTNARPGPNRASHQKNAGKRKNEMMSGARKAGEVQPFEAPNVRPRVSRRMAKKILQIVSGDSRNG
jgi:hypothetical protein